MARFSFLAILVGILASSTAGAQGQHPVVVIETSMGNIKVELYPDKAPITVKNFLQYVDDKFYDGVVFHRVMENFMIQGGGFDQQSNKKPTKAPIKNESTNGLSNERGTIAMARTNVPDSASSQFYINVVDNKSRLDKATAQDGVGYCVFGKVIDGMDVADRICKVKTGVNAKTGAKDWPVEPVAIKSIRRLDSK